MITRGGWQKLQKRMNALGEEENEEEEEEEDAQERERERERERGSK